MEAAEMDGASPSNRFCFIVLPAPRPRDHRGGADPDDLPLGILVEILVTTDGGPATESTTMTFLVYKEASSNPTWAPPRRGRGRVILANIVAIFLMRAVGRNLDA
jgi:sorbitol/mannitol transport system permease protein